MISSEETSEIQEIQKDAIKKLHEKFDNIELTKVCDCRTQLEVQSRNEDAIRRLQNED